jgi:Siphovirus ReqiPepy6 Gp37-like protein
VEIYTLDQNLIRDKVIDAFTSAVWTERFVEAGDCTIVLPATHERMKLLRPGTPLGLKGSDEIMLLDTRGVENGQMTVTGKTIEAFFDERNIDKVKYRNVPGHILNLIVDNMQQRHFGVFAIPRLRSGEAADAGQVVVEEVALGPAYATLLGLAQKYLIGMKVTWQTADDGKPELVFSTRVGVDRTSDQGLYDLVRLSPYLENLANVKELLSVAGSKTLVVVHPPAQLVVPTPPTPPATPENPNPATPATPPPIDTSGLADVTAGILTDPTESNPFFRRILEIDGSTLTLKPGTTVGELQAIMYNAAHAALHAAQKTHVVDGEVTAITKYVYGKHYQLGDIVEIEGYYGEPLKASVTEYIRTKDETGYRAYPTIASRSASSVAEPPPVVTQ